MGALKIAERRSGYPRLQLRQPRPHSQDPWEHALVHAAAGGLGATGLGAGMNAVKNSVVRNAIRGVAPALTAGAPFRSPPTPWSDAHRSLLLGQAAARGY